MLEMRVDASGLCILAGRAGGIGPLLDNDA
jgi:hypothetical protein